MYLRAALAALVALGAISGCFEINYGNCRITCSTTEVCPRTLSCVYPPGGERGLCAPPGTNTCSSFQPADAGGDDADGGVGADLADDGAPDAGDDGAIADAGPPQPPRELCHNGSCLTLPDAVRANVALLLWPSNLPALGAAVSVWSDQSGKGNHAHALYPSALPHVIANGVRLDANQLGSGFVIGDNPTLDFGSDDFAVIVVAGLTSASTPVSFFRKWDGARMDSRQIALDWVLTSVSTGRPQGAVNDTQISTGTNIAQPSVRAYTLRRAADHLELSVNEVVVGSGDLPVPGSSTTSAADVFIGVGGLVGSPVDSIQAVIAVRGAIGTSDLNELQAFLRATFAAAP